MSARTELPRPTRRRPHALAAFGVMGLLVLGLAACGDDDNDVDAGSGGATTSSENADEYGSGDTTADDGATEADTVVAKDFSFTSITVAPGAEVTFENEGDATHTMTADDGSFDTDEVSGGSSATITAPDEPGDYPFHCEIHSSMTGTLTVEA